LKGFKPEQPTLGLVTQQVHQAVRADPNIPDASKLTIQKDVLSDGSIAGHSDPHQLLPNQRTGDEISPPGGKGASAIELQSRRRYRWRPVEYRRFNSRGAWGLGNACPGIRHSIGG